MGDNKHMYGADELTVSVAPKSITLPIEVFELLNGKENVMIWYDDEKKYLTLKAVPEKGRNTLKLKSTKLSQSRLLQSTKFRSWLKGKMGRELENGRYRAWKNKEEPDTIQIDLSKPVETKF